MLTMRFFDLIEKTLQVVVFRYVALVGAELAVAGLRSKLVEQLVKRALIGAIGKGE